MSPPEQEYSQATRSLAVGTALGDDKLLIHRMSGTEQLGRQFEYHLELSSTDEKIEFEKILGTDMTVRFAIDGKKERYFNGIVSRFVMMSATVGEARYQATLVPFTWLLTRTSDCRIFQNKSVIDIIKLIFKERGLPNVDESLSGTYQPVDYIVQYRETDFNFISRLMEHEGIYYYFKHENGKHTMVLCDNPSAHNPYEGYDKIRFRESRDIRLGEEIIDKWELEKSVQPAGVEHHDFNFEQPREPVQGANSPPSPKHKHASEFRLFDYPGDFDEAGKGDDRARVRAEQLKARYETIHAHGNAKGIKCGSKFKLENFPRGDQNDECLITSANYYLVNPDFRSGGESEQEFTCSFVAIPAKTIYRPPRKTPKPVVQGPQTAIVVGPSGEEIFTDKYGRVKVRFHWDRNSNKHAIDQRSCWIRVSEAWAGRKWGTIFIPRIGQEVIVEFLEGDPDRPIITGRVYNAVEQVPYALPENKTMSTIKTSSSKGGEGFNEIRFEDKAGSEELFMHAQKDQNVKVLNNYKEHVNANRHKLIGNCQFEKIKKDKHMTVEGDHFEKNDGDQHRILEGDQMTKIEGSISKTVIKDWKVQVDGECGIKIAKDYNSSCDNYTIETNGNMDSKAGGDVALEASSNVHIKGGSNVVVEGGSTISLVVGGNFVTIDSGGVHISGSIVNINSGGSAGSGPGASPVSPAKPDEPEEPKEPGTVSGDPGAVSDVENSESEKPATQLTSNQAIALNNASQSGKPFCEECEAARRQQQQQQSQPDSNQQSQSNPPEQNQSLPPEDLQSRPQNNNDANQPNQSLPPEDLQSRPRDEPNSSQPRSNMSDPDDGPIWA